MLAEWLSYLLTMCENGSIYVRGAQGQHGDEITPAFISKREYGVKSEIERDLKTYNKRIETGFDPKNIYAFDCSGLGMYFIQNLKKIYNGDLTANGMRTKLCKKLLSRNDITRGDFLFVVKDNKADHVGFAISNDYCVEARGRDYGVIISKIDSRNFNEFRRPDFLKDEIEFVVDLYNSGNDLIEQLEKFEENLLTFF